MASQTVEELSGEARFDLKRQLADTLQGRIYSAIDKKTGEWVVVKETWKQLVKLGKSRNGRDIHENFEDEKKNLKHLSSSGLIRLMDEWEDDNCYIYAIQSFNIDHETNETNDHVTTNNKTLNTMSYKKLNSIKQQRKSQRRYNKFTPKYLNSKRYHKKYQYNRW